MSARPLRSSPPPVDAAPHALLTFLADLDDGAPAGRTPVVMHWRDRSRRRFACPDHLALGSAEARRTCFECSLVQAALDRAADGPRRRNCRNCGEDGHLSSGCPKLLVATAPLPPWLAGDLAALPKRPPGGAR